MTKKYNQHLNKVLNSHRYTEDHVYRQLITKRRQVVELIQKEYGNQIYSPFDSGSILKKTAIRSHFDYDIIVPFRYGTFRHPKEMRDTLYKFFQTKINGKEGLKGVRPQNVSIGLNFGIATMDYDFDIVPGLEMQQGEYDDKHKGNLTLYAHRNKNRKQITTNIKEQVDHFKKSPDAAINIVKLLKIWKYHRDVRIKSYLLELMAIEAMKNPPKHLWNQLRNTLIYIGDNIEKAKVTDPGNPKNHVGDSVEKKDKAIVATRIKKLVRQLDSEFKGGQTDILKKEFPI